MKAIPTLAIAVLVTAASFPASATGNISTTRTPNGFDRSATRTVPNGNAMIHNGSISVNPATRSVTRNSGTTLPNGKTYSTEVTRMRNGATGSN